MPGAGFENPKLPSPVQAMLLPETYPHPVGSIRVRETHISWVFLTGDWAYKIKKPVDFGFLDFATLAKRKHFCLRELQLNRRFAPEIYIDVVPLCAAADRIHLGGDGEVVEYSLKMRQFDDDELLLHRLRRRSFDEAWMDALAADIAAFHENAEIRRDMHATARLFDHLRDNLEVAARHVPNALDSRTLAPLRDYLEHSQQTQVGTLERRERDGCVRDVHGDLHLRNLVLIRGRPTPFDCIEFSDEFRCIDVLNDVAFLVMDCEAQGIAGAGYRFLSRYLEHTGDYAGLQALPLYLFYRATVRGKVACLQAQQTASPETIFDEARRYFRLAKRYAMPSRATVFAIGGLSGSGKSRLALLGCAQRRAIVIRSDATRKRIARSHPDLPLYGERMTALTYESMLKAAEQAAAAGFDAVMDATFLDPKWRQRAREHMHAARIPLRFFWLEAPPEILRARIRARSERRDDISDANLEVLEQQLRRYRRPDEPDIEFVDDSNRWP